MKKYDELTPEQWNSTDAYQDWVFSGQFVVFSSQIEDEMLLHHLILLSQIQLDLQVLNIGHCLASLLQSDSVVKDAQNENFVCFVAWMYSLELTLEVVDLHNAVELLKQPWHVQQAQFNGKPEISLCSPRLPSTNLVQKWRHAASSNKVDQKFEFFKTVKFWLIAFALRSDIFISLVFNMKFSRIFENWDQVIASQQSENHWKIKSCRGVGEGNSLVQKFFPLRTWRIWSSTTYDDFSKWENLNYRL